MRPAGTQNRFFLARCAWLVIGDATENTKLMSAANAVDRLRHNYVRKRDPFRSDECKNSRWRNDLPQVAIRLRRFKSRQAAPSESGLKAETAVSGIAFARNWLAHKKVTAMASALAMKESKSCSVTSFPPSK